MPANTAPIYTLTPVSEAIAMTAANVKSDGTGTIGTDLFFLVTAGTNGMWVAKVRFILAVASGTPTSAGAIGRLYSSSLSSGTPTTAQSSMLVEAALPAQTYSTTVPTYAVDVPVNQAIKGGNSLLCSTTVAPTANTAWKAIVFGGQY